MHFIFDTTNEPVPEGYDAVRVPLDGTLASSLDWHTAEEAARQYQEQGLRLFWDIDLGLFSGLALPLEHPAQVQSMGAALKHFCTTLLPEFGDDTVGINLYRGDAGDCDEARVELLASLATFLPEELDAYILLDATEVRDPLAMAALLMSDKLSPFRVGVKGGPLPLQGLGWEDGCGPLGYFGGNLPSVSRSAGHTIGVCWPESAEPVEALRSIFEQFRRTNVSFRLIAEATIATQWEGLEELVVVSESITFEGKRMLMGFAAAGGSVLTVGGALGVPGEVLFLKFGVGLGGSAPY